MAPETQNRDCSGSFELVRVRQDDLEDILTLEAACFGPGNRAPPELVRERYARYPGAWLARVAGIPAGFVTFAPVRPDIVQYIREHKPTLVPAEFITEPEKTDISCIYSLGVRPAYRSRFVRADEGRVYLSTLLIGAFGHAAQACGAARTLFLVESNTVFHKAQRLGTDVICAYSAGGLPVELCSVDLCGEESDRQYIAPFRAVARKYAPSLLDDGGKPGL